MNNTLDMMRARLAVRGGVSQQDRMISDKKKAFETAINYSYQGAKIWIEETLTEAPALINPNITKQDYDDKVLSIGFEYGVKPGTIFTWMNTDTH